MLDRPFIEIQWEVEGLEELVEERIAYLAQCKLVINCLENLEFKIILLMEDGLLKASFESSTKSTDAILNHIQISASLITSKGERWDIGSWRVHCPSKPLNQQSTPCPLARTEDLLDHENDVFFEGIARLSVQLKPYVRPRQGPELNLHDSCTYFVRSKVGVPRAITWKIENFSSIRYNSEEQCFRILQKLSTDKDEKEIEMHLSVRNGNVRIQVYPKANSNACVIMEEVSILRSDGLKEECWKREARAGIPRNSPIAFVDRQKLMDEMTSLLPEDVLTLFVKLRDFNNPLICYAGEMVEGVSPEFPRLFPDVESTSLSHDMNALLESGAHSDFILRAGGRGEEIPVLKSVLCARSPVFRAMLESPAWLESALRSADVPDFGPDPVRLLVRYLYSDRVPQRMDAADAIQLYSVSDKYAILGLRAHCARLLAQGLSADTACEALRLAERHADPDLMARVRAYIVDHHRAVFQSPEWAELMQEEPHLALELEQEMLAVTDRRTAAVVRSQRQSRTELGQRLISYFFFPIFAVCMGLIYCIRYGFKM